ncbi:hypothetical protein FOZ63_002635, partial [Perkinsus olseni]
GERVDKIKPGRYYGATLTAVGTLEWVEMNVVSTKDDDIKAWFLFGVLEPITPVRGTVKAPGHATGATNDDTPRETPVMSTEDAPSPSTTEAVTENPPGAGVNKMEPGLYYGAASITIGTLEWVEMNVVLSADDDVKAWFLFGNSDEK